MSNKPHYFPCVHEYFSKTHCKQIVVISLRLKYYYIIVDTTLGFMKSTFNIKPHISVFDLKKYLHLNYSQLFTHLFISCNV